MEQQPEPFPPSDPARFARAQMALFEETTSTAMVTQSQRAAGQKSFVIDSLLFFYRITREQAEALYGQVSSEQKKQRAA